jgi:tRNA pseudouridine55 synthase
VNFDGILLVDKPQDWSSFDVVAKIRGTLKQGTGQKIKVGHTGTLDPLATGLMIIVLGSYCKRASEFSKLDKTYKVTAKLGQTSTTVDEEGEKTHVSNMEPSLDEVKRVLGSFIGDSMQTPPIYSAIKINGQRAYKLARAGKPAKIEPRPIHISKLELNSYEFPLVSFTADVSSGTYIRSLVQDLGETLGTGAYMSDLRRTAVGKWSLQDSVIAPDNVTLEQIYNGLLA